MSRIHNALRLGRAIVRAESTIKSLEAGGPDETRVGELGEAYYVLGDALLRAERFSAAVEKLEVAHRLLWELPEERELAVQARVLSLGALMGLGQAEKTLAIATEIIDTNWRTDVRDIPNAMLWAYWWRVIALRGLSRDREALDSARLLVQRFAPGSTPVERQIVAKVLMTESELASSLGDPVAAMKAVGTLLSSYREDESPGVQSLVGEAQLALGSTAAASGRTDIARQAYSGLVTHFQATGSGALKAPAAEAERRLAQLPSE